ncbi:MAG: hypothetical protein ACE5E6_10910 [Phycisphaerae bacterium]
MPHLPPEHFEHNVDALAERQPDVADAVRSVPVPAGVSPATGRDGAPTLRVPGPDGDLIWFGGSSMPTVSADAIVGRVPDDGGNVTLPGVLTGLEPLLLTRRLPPHVATFVVESDLASLRLALHVYDYAPPIRAGRLVFITGADIVAHLRAFFDAHPGYAFPARLISVPHRAPSALAELTARLEHAADEVTRVQTRLIEHACKRLQARAPRAHTFAGAPANAAARDTAHAPRAPEHRPRVAVVSVDVSPATCAQTARIARALARLEWPHEICIPDAPDRCHVLARLAAVDRAAADFVLIVNGTTGLPRALLPDTLPVVSWCLPGTPPTMPASQLRALSADLRPADEVKFVVGDRADYDWARESIDRFALVGRCEILLSPVHGRLAADALAAWVLADRLSVRVQIQLHKVIWSPEARGV